MAQELSLKSLSVNCHLSDNSYLNLLVFQDSSQFLPNMNITHTSLQPGGTTFTQVFSSIADLMKDKSLQLPAQQIFVGLKVITNSAFLPDSSVPINKDQQQRGQTAFQLGKTLYERHIEQQRQQQMEANQSHKSQTDDPFGYDKFAIQAPKEWARKQDVKVKAEDQAKSVSIRSDPKQTTCSDDNTPSLGDNSDSGSNIASDDEDCNDTSILFSNSYVSSLLANTNDNPPGPRLFQKATPVPALDPAPDEQMVEDRKNFQEEDESISPQERFLLDVAEGGDQDWGQLIDADVPVIGCSDSDLTGEMFENDHPVNPSYSFQHQSVSHEYEELEEGIRRSVFSSTSSYKELENILAKQSS